MIRAVALHKVYTSYMHHAFILRCTLYICRMKLFLGHKWPD